MISKRRSNWNKLKHPPGKKPKVNTHTELTDSIHRGGKTYQSFKREYQMRYARCLNTLKGTKWFPLLDEERDTHRGLWWWKGQKKREASVLFLSMQICISSSREMHSNHRADQTALWKQVVSRIHLGSHAQSIKHNSAAGSVVQISETTCRIRSYSKGIRVSGDR